MIPFFTSPLISSLPHIRHGFFTRNGGVSTGYAESLNFNIKCDTPQNIQENRKRALAALCPENDSINDTVNLSTLTQVHSNSVIILDENISVPTEGDALVTTSLKRMLGVYTADCVPILLADTRAPIVGAVHSGWKGAFAGVIQNTLKAMESLGAGHIFAAVGPCIHKQSYEVGAEFIEYFENSFVAKHAHFDDFFTPYKEKKDAPSFHFDLGGLVTFILKHHGIEVDVLPYDTYTDSKNFFSYRRRMHKNEPAQGCQLSGICLR